MPDKVSLKEKIGQMLIVGFHGTTVEENSPIAHLIKNGEIGGVVLYLRNIENPAQVKQLTTDLQRLAAKSGQHLIIAVDHEGGKVNRFKHHYFPTTYSAQQFAQLPIKQKQQLVQSMTETLVDAGVNTNFAPVVDLHRPETFIAGAERSFSALPKEVAENAQLISQAHKNATIDCTYKHFPGHGSAAGDSHKGFVDVTKTWQSEELGPYKSLLNQEDACSMVMTAHVTHLTFDPSGKPATLSRAIIEGILRQKIRFQGIVVSDCMQMKAIQDNYTLEEALELSINAGVNMLIFGHPSVSNQPAEDWQNPEAIIDLIYRAVVISGKIHPDIIEDNYQRILQLKKKMTSSSPKINS
ncbi:glycosyl hydrolase domain-containing hypothetical protein [Candidatus Regiella insecticola LSR1]|uniref:Glycoside hydrolase family 3 N-terminal domain-containing protein n=1 Tax=Candidatus Regiella insecticola LSR1 TaxID=663321 RepID=E0WQZ4_9ENTR|nr:glycoside hydrolase family 3 N-terminal domain-containing protein [Candidatus Regiella insecticola]EFL92554.1 glycosyl hydrolase domain-containing hypothetical protein [Candidatus Regiella insecticola LSR1]